MSVIRIHAFSPWLIANDPKSSMTFVVNKNIDLGRTSIKSEVVALFH